MLLLYQVSFLTFASALPSLREAPKADQNQRQTLPYKAPSTELKTKVVNSSSSTHVTCVNLSFVPTSVWVNTLCTILLIAFTGPCQTSQKRFCAPKGFVCLTLASRLCLMHAIFSLRRVCWGTTGVYGVSAAPGSDSIVKEATQNVTGME